MAFDEPAVQIKGIDKNHSLTWRNNYAVTSVKEEDCYYKQKNKENAQKCAHIEVQLIIWDIVYAPSRQKYSRMRQRQH